MKKQQNIFLAMLDLLNVKHTKGFSSRFFNEHPHKNNLYGLSKMLSDYGISDAATRIEEKEADLTNIELLFVAQVGGDFVVIYKVISPTPAIPEREVVSSPSGELEEAVHFIRNGKKLSISVSQFIQSWSGVILLAETSPESGEPDYREHRKNDLLNTVQLSILAIAVALVLGIAYINNIYVSQLGEFNSPNNRTNICIQYIFSTFNQSQEYANKHFIAIYLEKGAEVAWQMYSTWFERGKELKEAFFGDLNLDMSNPAIEVEFQKHESWKEKTQLRATPTILVNGYKLPDNYKIEDLRYFMEFDVNIK